MASKPRLEHADSNYRVMKETGVARAAESHKRRSGEDYVVKMVYTCVLMMLLSSQLVYSQEGEPPVGDLVVYIIQPESLWYFPTVVPNGYHRSDVAEARVTSSELNGQGTFKWEVLGAKGYNALGLIPSGGGSAQTVTKLNDKYVNIFTKSYSDADDDVTLRLTYTPPDASSPAITVEKSLTIRTFRLVIDTYELYYPLPSGRWEHRRRMIATDQFGVNAIPKPIDINEYFTNWQSLYSGENWKAPQAWPFPGAIAWSDRVNPGVSSTIPLPVHRGQSGDSTPVDEAQQTWRYGSMTVGGGEVFLNGNINWRRYRGYAEHAH